MISTMPAASAAHTRSNTQLSLKAVRSNGVMASDATACPESLSTDSDI
jgi:hypothetical protein